MLVSKLMTWCSGLLKSFVHSSRVQRVIRRGIIGKVLKSDHVALDPLIDFDSSDSVSDGNGDKTYTEFQGFLIEDYVAPLFADILSARGLPLVGIHTSEINYRVRGLGRPFKTTEFVFVDSMAAQALVELIINAWPAMRDNFGVELVDDEKARGFWGLDSRIVVEEENCEDADCGMRHATIYSAIFVPKSRISKLTEAVHHYLYPSGIPDIVDIV